MPRIVLRKLLVLNEPVLLGKGDVLRVGGAGVGVGVAIAEVAVRVGQPHKGNEPVRRGSDRPAAPIKVWVLGLDGEGRG
jgi:hypothetical protein